MPNLRNSSARVVLALLATLSIYCAFPAAATSETSAGPSIRLYFSPKGGGTEAIISEIRHARAEVLVQAYSFSSAPIAHNKIMVIDRECVITGSFNFTKAAEEKNAENILVIRGDPDLTSKYIGNFDWHLRHSDLYQGRDG